MVLGMPLTQVFEVSLRFFRKIRNPTAASAKARRTASTDIPAMRPVFEPFGVACGVWVDEIPDAVFEEAEEDSDPAEVDLKSELD